MGLKRFDFKLKDNSKKKSIIVASIIVLVLLIGVTIYATYAAYKVTNTYNIIQGKVKEFVNADITLNIVAIDKEGNETSLNEFPSKDNYAFNYLLSECQNDSEIEFNTDNWTASITSAGKDKCTFYFRERLGDLAEDIIAKAQKEKYLYKELTDFGFTDEDEFGLYTAPDDYATSYYFRGNPANNYVQFGTYAAGTTVNGKTYQTETPIYWRIVRINGDGTIRLIYDGPEKVTNGTAHTATIANTVYNLNADDPKYVGYTYDDGTGKQVDSTIKGIVDDWYEANLKTNYEKNIEDSIFCNDRSAYEYQSDGSYKEIIDNLSNYKEIEFGYYVRDGIPSLKCPNKNDRYTVNDTTLGNGKLSNPVGLLTVDEDNFAGTAINGSTSGYYLHSYEKYWSFTPAWFYDNAASVVIIGYNPNYDIYDGVNLNNVGVRPVVNLKANVKFEGNGSFETPYIISD